MATIEEVRPLVETKLSQLGLELFDIKYVRAGPKSILRVFIDKDGGVTIDDCEKASNEISIVLDVEDFSGTPYRLEVSSPGADRPLRTEKDFRRAQGRTVNVRFGTALGVQQSVAGEIVDCAGNVLRLAAPHGVIEIELSSIASAKLELSFK